MSIFYFNIVILKKKLKVHFLQIYLVFNYFYIIDHQNKTNLFFVFVYFNQKKSNIEGERDLSIEENGKFNNKKIKKFDVVSFIKAKTYYIFIFFIFYKHYYLFV